MQARVMSDPELVQRRQLWEARLRDVADSPVYLSGRPRSGRSEMYTDPVRRMHEALEDLKEGEAGLRDERVFRPLIVNAGLHGVHFIDKIFGAEVFELHSETNNWQAKYLKTPVGTLERPDLASHPTWKAAQAFAEAFVASGVAVPVFALPTIASALNIAINLYGQAFLMALLSDPDDAEHDLEVINGVLLEIHAWYRNHIPAGLLQQVASGGRYQPPGCGQVCGCSSQLISAALYRDFIAKRDDAILSSYPGGGMIHLCGTHTQHMETWRAMRSLRAVQLNDRAAEDLEIYLAAMPERIFYVSPCEVMPLEKVETLARKNRIVICAEPASDK